MMRAFDFDIAFQSNGKWDKETNSASKTSLGSSYRLGRNYTNFSGAGPCRHVVYREEAKARSIGECSLIGEKGKLTGTILKGARLRHHTASLSDDQSGKVPVAVQQLSAIPQSDMLVRAEDEACHGTYGLTEMKCGYGFVSDRESLLRSSTSTAFDTEGSKVNRVDETTMPEKVLVWVMVVGRITQRNTPLKTKRWVQENVRFVLLVADYLKMPCRWTRAEQIQQVQVVDRSLLLIPSWFGRCHSISAKMILR